MARFGGLDPYVNDENLDRVASPGKGTEARSQSHFSPGLSAVVLNRNSPEMLESVLVGLQAAHETSLFVNNDVLLSRNPSCLWTAYQVQRRTKANVSVVLDFEDGRVWHRGVDFLRADPSYGLSFRPGAGAMRDHTSERNSRAGRDWRISDDGNEFVRSSGWLR